MERYINLTESPISWLFSYLDMAGAVEVDKSSNQNATNNKDGPPPINMSAWQAGSTRIMNEGICP
jgi:hypothetical protein